MATPIEKARTSVAKAMKRLPALGLRTDYELVLRRWVEEGGNPLSMDPADAPERIPSLLAIDAPDVAGLDTLNAYGFERGWVGGGLVQAGDMKVRVVRTPEVESFLGQRLDTPAAEGGGPYPEMGRVEWLLNDEIFQAVTWKPGPIFLDVVVRRTEGG